MTAAAELLLGCISFEDSCIITAHRLQKLCRLIVLHAKSDAVTGASACRKIDTGSVSGAIAFLKINTDGVLLCLLTEQCNKSVSTVSYVDAHHAAEAGNKASKAWL